MKTKLLLAVALLVLLFTWFVGRIAVGSSKANRARAEEQKARSRAQEIAEMLAVRGVPRKISPASAAVSATVTVRGRLFDRDGKPLGQRALGFVKEGLRLGDAGFSFMSDGLTGDDGSFRFEMPVGQSWQALPPEGGTLDGPRSEVLKIDAAGGSADLHDALLKTFMLEVVRYRLRT